MEPTELRGRDSFHGLAGAFTVAFSILFLWELTLFFVAHQSGSSTGDALTWVVSIGGSAVLTIAAAVTFYVTGRRSR